MICTRRLFGNTAESKPCIEDFDMKILREGTWGDEKNHFNGIEALLQGTLLHVWHMVAGKEEGL